MIRPHWVENHTSPEEVWCSAYFYILFPLGSLAFEKLELPFVLTAGMAAPGVQDKDGERIT